MATPTHTLNNPFAYSFCCCTRHFNSHIGQKLSIHKNNPVVWRWRVQLQHHNQKKNPKRYQNYQPSHQHGQEKQPQATYSSTFPREKPTDWTCGPCDSEGNIRPRRLVARSPFASHLKKRTGPAAQIRRFSRTSLRFQRNWIWRANKLVYVDLSNTECST